MSSGGDPDEFWRILNDRMENLIYPALMTRHNTLVGTKADVAPILWKDGAIARLKSGEVIDELLYDNYSTLSIGYCGLYETVKYMTGMSHTDDAARTFAKEVLQFLNDKASDWNSIEDVGFSVYGTPLESTTFKLAKSLKKRFGEIEGITDRDYVSNSFH